MNDIKYFAPKSLPEVVSLLSEYGEKARVIAGGTDLLKQIKDKTGLTASLIDIGDIIELIYIKHDEIDGLRIGALTPIASIQKSSVIQSRFRLLAQATATLGTPAIRNQATIGGNICNAAPSADIVPALVVLEAIVKILGADGETRVPIEDFFTGPGKTVIKPGTMLAEVQVPNLPSRSGAAYLKHRRTKGADLAIVGVATLLTMKGDIIEDVKIALGAVAPTPIRARKAETVLKGSRLDDRLLKEAGLTAANEAKPIDDTRSTAAYRRRLIPVLIERAVRQAREQVQMEA